MCSMHGAGILHADLDAFYASVEQRDDPALRGQPIAVGGGVVLAASYEARRFGVRTAMSLREARACCGALVVVAPRMEAYTEASRAVFDIFHDTTPLVEGLSVDEAFLDVSGLGRLVGSPEMVARRLRSRVDREVGLAISVGIARTKFLAKVASGVSKPNGLLRVDPDAELEFLHPLPVQKLWGVGSVTAEKLAAHGIKTVGDVADVGAAPLVAVLGPGAGRHLHALAHNHDPRRVTTGRRRSSIGSQRALGRRPRQFCDLQAILLELVDRVTRRLRSGDRVGRTLTLRFRFGDFTRGTRSYTLSEATDSTAVFLTAARTLLHKRQAEIERRRLTLLGLTIANLSPADAVQQILPFDRSDDPALDRALDSVRDRFGSTSIARATLLGRPSGPLVPVLADPGAPAG